MEYEAPGEDSFGVMGTAEGWARAIFGRLCINALILFSQKRLPAPEGGLAVSFPCPFLSPVQVCRHSYEALTLLIFVYRASGAFTAGFGIGFGFVSGLEGVEA